MMSSQNTASQVSFASVIGIVFVVLKLAGIIDWSWIWVLSPWWIMLSLMMFVIVLFTVVDGIQHYIRNSRRWAQNMKKKK